MPQIECPYCCSGLESPSGVAGASFRCPKCDGEIEISEWGEAIAIEYGYGGVPLPQQSGYVKQVKVVAILMIVQGSFESLIGLGVGLFFPVMMQIEPDPNAPPIAIFIGIGLAAIGIGVSRIIAGILNLKMRGRVFAIVTHFIGFLTACTFYCAPTAIGLAIYGLIIHLNHDVVEAFQRQEKAA